MIETGVTTRKLVGFAAISFVATLSVIYAVLLDNPAAPLVKSPDRRKRTAGKLLPLKFKTLKLDFGDVSAGLPLEGVFEFTNQTDKVIKDIFVHPNCGCTNTLLSKKDIGPGETGRIKSVLRTDGYSGLMDKNIEVTAGNVDGITVLKLLAYVVPNEEVRPFPPAVLFDRVPEGKSAETKVTLVVKGAAELFMTRLHTSSPYIKADVSRLSTFQRIILDLKLKPGLKPGMHEAAVVVYYTSRSYPYVEVPVRIVIVPAEDEG